MNWIYILLFFAVAVGVGVYLEHREARGDRHDAALRSANRRDKGGGR